MLHLIYMTTGTVCKARLHKTIPKAVNFTGRYSEGILPYTGKSAVFGTIRLWLSPDASGRAVFGQFLIDGEKTRFNRCGFYRYLRRKVFTDWAKEKLEILTLSKIKRTQNPVMKGL